VCGGLLSLSPAAAGIATGADFMVFSVIMPGAEAAAVKLFKLAFIHMQT